MYSDKTNIYSGAHDETEDNIEKYKDFIRERITELRLKADVSEYQMSFELGKSRSYVQEISRGKALPSMTGFLNICDYFGITPAEFFDPDVKSPDLLKSINQKLKFLSDDDLLFFDEILRRLNG